MLIIMSQEIRFSRSFESQNERNHLIRLYETCFESPVYFYFDNFSASSIFSQWRYLKLPKDFKKFQMKRNSTLLRQIQNCNNYRGKRFQTDKLLYTNCEIDGYFSKIV